MKAVYFYDGMAITRKQFESNVPENWLSEIDEFGQYSWGYYRVNVLELNGVEY